MPTVSASLRKRRRKRPASPIISNLGDDLLVEILIRGLPDPRSACRSKAVCKRWSSLLSGPAFNRRFVSHYEQKRPPLLLPLDHPQTASVESCCITIPANKSHWEFLAVLDSFKDLILCGFEYPAKQRLAELSRTFFVCNPFANSWVALPLAPERPSGDVKLAVKLVCQPVVSHLLDLGAGSEEEPFVYSEYRFRTVCLYQYNGSIILDVFCSESESWTKEALVLSGHLRIPDKNVLSCNGTLFYSYVKQDDAEPLVAALDAFRLDIPPTSYSIADNIAGGSSRSRWDISIAQDALHFVVLDGYNEQRDSGLLVCHVFRLIPDEQSWERVLGRAVLKRAKWSTQDIALSANLQREAGRTRWTGYEPEDLHDPCLHPEDPQIVFFTFDFYGGRDIVSWDMSKAEVVEFYCLRTRGWSYRWALFQLRASCWPTPIPKYKQWSHRCWALSGSAPVAPSITDRDRAWAAWS